MPEDHRPNSTPRSRPKRPKPISWRPPAEKRAAFEARVAESGLSTNAFITEAVFGRTRYRQAEQQALAQILAQCAEIADGMRRIDAEGNDEARLEALDVALREVRSALFLLMGRRP